MLQIQQEQRRERIGGTIGILPFAGQVLNRRLAIANVIHRIERVIFLERAAHQENIVLIVFRQKHWAEIRH